MINFRKFRKENNTVEFVNSKGIQGKKKIISNEGIKENINLSENDDDVNVASVTTLIVGKNNAGKTTVITALEKILSKNKEKTFIASDFNLRYLEECMDSIKNYPEKSATIEAPYMEFVVTIALEEDSDDRVTNLIPFMLLEDISDSELEIRVRYEIVERESFIAKAKALLDKYATEENLILYKFLNFMDGADFKINYYDKNGQSIDKEFRLTNLIDLQVIGANKIPREHCLSDAFNKIVKYQHEHVFHDTKEKFEEPIDKLNKDLTQNIRERHTEPINKSLSQIISMNHMKVNLTADVTFEKILKDLIRYQYVEKDLNIPENQFGMGYTSLMMIIATLIDYMEHYPEVSFNSKINIIAIEEPETFMHPQMQELFIKNINDAIKALLESKNKRINSQLIITTHSSHILNSKIHSGNSFDNINYIYDKENYSRAVNLDNSVVMSSYTKDTEAFKFLKKHIKYKVSELFFSDAVIFVEGLAEETLLPYYIEQNNGLNKYYVSIFNISGAHAFLYYDLIKALGVPVLIVTDLDIKKKPKTDEEKELDKEEDEKSYSQIDSLEGMITTNQTIIKFQNGLNDISSIDEHDEDENMYLAHQWKIGDYYATSFEEAFILTNYDNDILNEILKELKPRLYKEIMGEKQDKKNHYTHSREWQKKLSDSKGDFASNMLFKIVQCESEEKIPKLPSYIEKGLKWLEGKLKEGEENESDKNS